ncbi:hypothetical protein [Chelativorans sp. M5D2P16]|uniref:hypothetical protein n=1 Tax=Chelativorans sp. M5D2P16 TaxID=3095678 RepID=UPI002ACB04D1|nr:hypothetical protein [Chelativorans sp. M5D2P16]MDZ5699795.1 hypothetical protein [Chelativorans sp. M5D2P16]
MNEIETGGRGARDAAKVLPFLAAVLLAPPIVLIFTAPVTIAGMPLIVVYLFGVWTAVVFAAFLLSRRLAEGEAPGDEPRRPSDGKRR